MHINIIILNCTDNWGVQLSPESADILESFSWYLSVDKKQN